MTIKLIVTDRAGAEHSIDAQTDISLMEAIRDNGMDELMALCGGCCSCATCHVYIDSGDEQWAKPRNDDENDLLDSSDHRTDRSRLSCQVKLTDAMDGLRVTIAPED